MGYPRAVRNFLLVALILLSGFFLVVQARKGQLLPISQPSSSTPTAPATAPEIKGNVHRLVEPSLPTVHGLVDESGKVIAFLQSVKIDLDFLEGRVVSIEGRRIRYSENNLPIIQVEKVKF